MTTVMRKTDSLVSVPQQALERVREVLRAVAAGDPVDDAASAAQAAYALAALPQVQRMTTVVA